MDDNINIKCPGCGTILTIRKQSDWNNALVTCPICKKKSRIVDCECINEQKDADATQYKFVSKKSDEDTILNIAQIVPIGRLINMQTGSTHQLNLGKNTIGRMVSNPLPTVTVPIEEKQTHNTMSREHAVIEVTKLANGSYRHFLYNWKNKNSTYLDGKALEDNERIVLNGGEMIKMGQVLIRFETKQ